MKTTQHSTNPMLIWAIAQLTAAAIFAGFLGGYALSNALDRLVELLTRAHVLL